MRAVVAGDVHGNIDHLYMLLDVCESYEASHLIACGDFGFWPHMEWGREFLDEVELGCADRDVTLIWIDGNHDNHDVIAEMQSDPLTGWDGELMRVSSHVWHCGRGAAFELGDLSCVGFGGAYSVDWMHRDEGVSWWAGELITREQVDAFRARADARACASGRAGVDVLFTHEAPVAGGHPASQGADDDLSYKDEIAESIAQRMLMAEVTDIARADVQFTGHHHVRRSFVREAGGHRTSVHVLARDTMGAESFYVLDCTCKGLETLMDAGLQEISQ
jgi:predicted phosphodiesterase